MSKIQVKSIYSFLQVFPSDRMLSYICDRCRFFMDLCYKYKQICRQADEAILQYIQNDEPLEPIPWPSKLTKVSLHYIYYIYWIRLLFVVYAKPLY